MYAIAGRLDLGFDPLTPSGYRRLRAPELGIPHRMKLNQITIYEKTVRRKRILDNYPYEIKLCQSCI